MILNLQDSGLVRRLERLCDTAVQLESFAGSDQEKNPVYKEYHGKKIGDLSPHLSKIYMGHNTVPYFTVLVCTCTMLE